MELLLVKLHLSGHLGLLRGCAFGNATVPGPRGASANRARNARECT
jgi:hypothetical protein